MLYVQSNALELVLPGLFPLSRALLTPGLSCSRSYPRQLWDLYNHIPSKRSADAAEVRKLQTEYLKIRRDLHATSSQDEFAKWARLRRQHDKMLEDLEKKSACRHTLKSAFY